ncbi:hypothetical protein CAOG_02475 [Capsaspora owczarzaki ATCC 30864]|uniref:hypothetical protein n=1 Tax=Capsaspora owczarzaki (strain ATCC 30864) TaxID=595528 RepID=UPI0003521822|nr:hypothetical protein CAOG_02475 [Capsaspora owczarzaki ATCC 30864]|eukprot:XP_004349225.2 hypothetical protein CAOG_02475 [Capsaspora owczarzaki ATCC 30864]
MLSYQNMNENQRRLYDEAKEANRSGWLDLRHNEIGDAEAQAIAEALKVNTETNTILLGKNRIGDAGAQAIAEALKVNKSVITLYVEGNQIGDAGAQAIAETLKVNTTLTVLDVSDNQIGDAGAQAIFEAIKVNPTVTFIDLHTNEIGDAAAQVIAEALKLNKTVAKLRMDLNQIGDAGAQAIADALKANTSLTALSLGRNQIGTAGALAIAEALQVNKTLTSLYLQYNCIGNVGVEAIDEARKVHGTSEVSISDQINPLAFSLLPRLATAEDLQAVFCLLISGSELQDQSASLPVLPPELAERIMDEAHYFQGVQHTKRSQFSAAFFGLALNVTLPRNSVRVKSIQVLRDCRASLDEIAFDVNIRDDQGAVRYECAAKPAFVESTIQLVTICPASHPFLRQIRESWQVQVQPSKVSANLRFESLYVGYV